MAERVTKSLADYVALAICPVLIMGLVGSLVFFVMDVCYQGEYQSRLAWVMFFFVFGMVLICRIAFMSEIAARAPMYALALGWLVWVGLQYYVDYTGHVTESFAAIINAGLLLLSWWCAYKLTWDCTTIDDDLEVKGEGLLQTAGLEEGPVARYRARHEQADEKPEEESKGGGVIGWIERYRRYREQSGKRRTPGVWVVYFSLAALPIFGLGQSLIPVEEGGRRGYAFFLMTVYVGSGLGLLLTTCFLGLRRYLRQRKLRMPKAMTASWLTLGGGLIAVMLLVAAVLPRPWSETAVFDFQPVGSKDQKASKYAQKGDSAAKDQGKPGESDKKDARDKGESGKDRGEKDKGDSGKTDQKDKGGKDKGDQKDKGDGEKDKGGGKDGKQKSDNSDSKKGESNKNDGQQSSERSSTSAIAQTIQNVAGWLKWVVFGVLILVTLWYVFRSGLSFLSNFTQWAKNLLDALNGLWANLFGGRKGASEEEEGPAEVAAERARSFADFDNPFADGNARRWPAERLLRYTFAAFQAWARERGVDYQSDETAMEFARRVGDEYPAVEADARRVALLLAQALYAESQVPANTPEVVRRFWEVLAAGSNRPVSA